jgi:hypothetical protein
MGSYGYFRASASSPDAGVTGATTTNQRFTSFPQAVGHQWAYRWNGHVGKNGATSVSVQGGVQSLDSGGNPAAIVALTDAFTVSTPMTGGGDGAISTSDLQAVLKLFDGKGYAVGFAAINAALTHGMRAAGDAGQPDDANDLFYYRNKTTLPPTDGYASTSVEGWLAVWLTTESNVAPDAPATVTVAGTASTDPANPAQIGTFAPVVTGLFRDGNETVGPFGVGQADKLKRFQYQIIDPTTGHADYDSNAVTATSAEQTARQFTRTYGGPALVAGKTYKLRCRVYDQFDAVSDWSDYRYFVVGAGSMDSLGTPTGKQITQTPGPFTGTWHHTGGLATNAIQVSIRDADTGAVLRSSGLIAKTVANGGAVSVTWAETGFAALDWGSGLVWTMRGRDTAGTFGSYADVKALSIDAAPSVPAPVAPANNAVVTTRPLLAATVSDADDAQAALTAKFRIKDASGAVLFTRTGTRNVATGRFEYQTTATDLPSFATYTWDAYAFDGTVYSGGTTVEASAQKSGQRSFAYANGPQPVITSPTDGSTIATATPTIAYTVTGQVSRRITVVRTGVTIHDFTGVGSATTYPLPSALSSGEALEEGDVVTITVDVADANGLHGIASVTVTVDYPTPETLGLSASLGMAEGDVTPSFVLLSWPQSSYPVSDQGSGAFSYYRLTRKPTAAAIAANPDLPPDAVKLPTIRSVTQTSYEDHTARAGVEYTWSLKQYVLANGVSLLGSATDFQVLRVDFEATIIHDARDPKGSRIVLAAREDRTITPVDDLVLLMPWNQGKPIHLRGETYYTEIDCTYAVLAETPEAASAIVRRAQAMARNGGPMQSRDGRGTATP